MVDVTAIQTHVEFLTSLPVPGTWMVSSYGEDPATGEKLIPKVHIVSDVGLAVATIASWTQETHRNVYISAATMVVPPPPGTRGFETDIAYVPYLVADFDDLDAANWPTRVPFMPSWVLETSPGRFQCGFVFDRLVTPDEAKPLARGLKAFCRCDHGTGDIAHVWRIPGTINWPNARKAATGRHVCIVRKIV